MKESWPETLWNVSRDQKKMCYDRHYREGERSKVEIVWTCNKKRLRKYGQRHYGMKRSEEYVRYGRFTLQRM